MDVKNFQESRNKEIEEFKKYYYELRTRYNSLLSSAIKESDPSSQQNLIQEVLNLNSEMTNEIRTVLGELNKGTDKFDPKSIDELTNELIQYQKDYSELEKSKDKVETLKLIRASTSKNLSDATFMYYIYLFALLLLTFIVIYMVFRTSILARLSEVKTMIMPQQ